MLAEFCFADEQLDQGLEKLITDMLAGSDFSHRANKGLFVETDGMRLSEGRSLPWG